MMSEWLAEMAQGGKEEQAQLALEGDTRPIPSSAGIGVGLELDKQVVQTVVRNGGPIPMS